MSTKEITIAGATFPVTTPYEAGHSITEAEAKALNQVRCENIRNNTAKAVKEALENGGDASAIVSKYDAEYTFTLGRVGGRRSVDPLERETERLAKALLVQRIREAKGMTVKAYIDAGNQAKYDAALEQLTQDDTIVKAAKANIKRKADMATSAGSDLGL